MLSITSLFIFVLTLMLFNRVSRLNERIQHIEKYLQTTTDVMGAASAHVSGLSVSAQQQTIQESVVQLGTMRTASAVPLQVPSKNSSFVTWLKEDWLMKLGGLFFMLGMGWFVSYAFMMGWIGAMGRIGLGLCLGGALLMFGYHRIQKFLTQGSILLVIGAATILLTVYAGRTLYDFFTPALSLAIMFFVASTLGLISIKFKHRPLAHANVILVGVAPILTPELISSTNLLIYLLVLTLGSQWVVIYTGWRSLSLLSLSVVFLYNLPILYGEILGEPNGYGLEVGLMFSFVFTTIYFLVSILSLGKSPRLNVSDLLTALLSGTFLFLWITIAAPLDWQSVLFVMWTLVFASGAFFAVRFGSHYTYFYTYGSVGVAYIGVATAIELQGLAFTIVTAIEAALLIWLGYRVTGSAKRLPVLAVPSLVPLSLSLHSISSSAWSRIQYCSNRMTDGFSCTTFTPTTWYDRVFHQDAVVVVLTMVLALLLGLFFYSERLRSGDAHERKLLRIFAGMLFSIGGVYAAILTWLVPHAIFSSHDTGTMVTLALYTLVGSFCFIQAKLSGVKWQRIVAHILFGMVTARLLFVEVWSMELSGRIITFIAIGVALIVVAWLERNVDRTASAQVLR